MKKRIKKILFHSLIVSLSVFIVVLLISKNIRPEVFAQTVPPATDWYMSGANLERNSHVSNGVTGNLGALWYRPIEPYIPPFVQLVITNNTIYVATSKGIYALNTADGAVKWVYPTELPVGNSPTVVSGVVYFGGFDHRLYAVRDNGTSASLLWIFDGASAGYDTNPLVVNNMVYLGNRDGYFYAVNATNGSLVWKYKTDAAIRFSAAYKNNTLYFGSDDSNAYALNTQCSDPNGCLVWKTLIPYTMGFHDFWPVIYNNPQTNSDTVIFVGSANYDSNNGLDLQNRDGDDFILPNYNGDIGTRDPNNPLRLNVSSVARYWEDGVGKPYRRTVFVFDAQSGQEIKFNLNGSGGNNDYAPIFWWGTRSGMRFPPVLGGDGLIYFADPFKSKTQHAYSVTGSIVGWEMSTPWIRTPGPTGLSADEPLAYASGGNVIYWNLCCDRSTGAFDLGGTNWTYINYGGSSGDYIGYYPDYTPMTMRAPYSEDGLNMVYGNGTGGGLLGQPAGVNGQYGYHGPQNPPIPYAGRVYTHRGNTVFAFATGGSASSALPMAATVVSTANPPAVDTNAIKAKLISEVQKIIAPGVGHLKPIFGVHGASDSQMGVTNDGGWSYPFQSSWETFLALSRAYPYLSSADKTSLLSYLATEFSNYNPCTTASNGWSGAARDSFTLPPDITTSGRFSSYAGYSIPPQGYYALWKYALIAGNAHSILQTCGALSAPPSSSVLQSNPEAHNAWIMGYIGYVNLLQMDGQSVTSAQNTLNNLMSTRLSNLSVSSVINPMWNTATSAPAANYRQLTSASRNMMYMTPEFGTYLRTNGNAIANNTFNVLSGVVPYWMSSNFDAGYGENAVAFNIDYPAFFGAKAWIANASQPDLARYLDGPAWPRGDLNFINNAVTVLEAGGGITPTPTPVCGALGDVDCSGQVNVIDLAKLILKFGQTVAGDREDIDGSGKVNSLDLSILLNNFGR